MGMYTEFFFRAEVKASQETVQGWLKHKVAGNIDYPFDDHPFFALPRWRSVFNCMSAYFPTRGSEFSTSPYGAHELFIHISMKNYDGEIEAFMDWITPWLAQYPGDFLGYALYEESSGDDGVERPKLFFMPEVAA